MLKNALKAHFVRSAQRKRQCSSLAVAKLSVTNAVRIAIAANLATKREQTSPPTS